MKYKINISSRRNVWRSIVDFKSDYITCSDVKCEVVDDCNTCIFDYKQYSLEELKEIERLQER